MRTRLTTEELSKAHDGLCGVAVGDGPCACLVHWVVALQQEADELRHWVHEYGSHYEGCPAHSNQARTCYQGPCDCGLTALKTKYPEQPNIAHVAGDVLVQKPEASRWGPLRGKCFDELGFALLYMDHLNENWPKDQRDRVDVLCREVAANQQNLSLVYWEKMWARISDETENLC